MNAPRDFLPEQLLAAGRPTHDWREIPVFVFVRDALDASRDLVAWLKQAGMERVVLLDCGSSTPALLAWYRALPAGMEVLFLGLDADPSVFWRESVHEELGTPFVVTEAGYVPSASCPRDLVGRLLSVLERYPDCGKVSAAVRVDNIGNQFADAELIRRWEAQFWMNPVDDDLYAAATERGFCLYPAHGEPATGPANLRVGGQYLVEYRPWYLATGTVVADDDHPPNRGARRDPAAPAWGPRTMRERLRRSAAVLAYDYRPKILALRGDTGPVPGWLNAGRRGTGCQLNLAGGAAAGLHGALEDNSLDGIHWPVETGVPAPNCTLLRTFYRAAKHGARLWLRVSLTDLDETLAVCAGHDAGPSATQGTFDWMLESCGLLAGSVSESAGEGDDRVALVLRACKPPRTADEIAQALAVQPTLYPDRRAAPGFTCV
jgi:hypothetical protein